MGSCGIAVSHLIRIELQGRWGDLADFLVNPHLAGESKDREADFNDGGGGPARLQLDVRRGLEGLEALT